jgi:hypothetical protein
MAKGGPSAGSIDAADAAVPEDKGPMCIDFKAVLM